MKSFLRRSLLLALFVSGITNVFAFNPAEHFDQDTYAYFEIYPAESSVKKLKKLFFSLMNKDKAETEWKSFEDYFIEETGINFLSTDLLQSSGFNTAAPIGAGMNYNIVFVKNNKNIVNKIYNKSLTILLPVVNSEKAYRFLLDNLQKNLSVNRNDSQNKYAAPSVIEMEKDKLVKIYDPAKSQTPFFIFRSDDTIVISENASLIKKFASVSARNIGNDTCFQKSKKYYDKGKNNPDMIGFFFVNQKISDAQARLNPRLLFDNILMDNTYIKELSANSECISGAVTVNDQGFKISANYTFEPDYLTGNNSFLSSAFNFAGQSFFPDNITALPMAFFKWQTNFPEINKKTPNRAVINNYDIEKFFTRLTGGVSVAAPENLNLIFKDNISFYIQDAPSLKDINSYYLWKGYLSANYNPEYFIKFQQFMDNLVSASKNNKNISIVYSKSGEKSQWELNISRFIKKYDKSKDQVIYEENIVKMYIFSDSSQIIITNDPLYLKKKPPESASAIYNRLLPENHGGKRMIFSFLDGQKFLKYISKSALAFSENYLSYFENVKSIFFLVSRENDAISEEIIVKLVK